MWYDVLVLAILFVSMVRGAVRGVVWQLAGIAGIVLCLVFAETISAIGSPLVGLEPPLNQWVVMFGGYLFFSFMSFGFARILHGALEKAELKEYNKHLGAVFGVVKGAVFCLVLTFFLVTLSQTTRTWLQTSRSARVAAIIMDRLHPVMPDKLRGALARYIHDLDAADLNLKHADATQPYGDPNVIGGSQPATTPGAWDPFGNSAGTTPSSNGQPISNGGPFGNSPTSGTTQTPPANGGQTNPWSLPPSGTPAGDTVDQLLSRIPGLSQNEWMRGGVREVYDRMSPESRQQMIQELQNAGPGLVAAVFQKWQSQPAAPAQPAGSSSPLQDWFGGNNSNQQTQNVGYSQSPAKTQPPANQLPTNPPASTGGWGSIFGGGQSTNAPSAAPQTANTRETLVAAIAGRLAQTVQQQPQYQDYINKGLQGLPDPIVTAVLQDWQVDLAGGSDPDPQTNRSSSLDQRIIRQLTVQQVSIWQLGQELQTRLMQSRR